MNSYSIHISFEWNNIIKRKKFKILLVDELTRYKLTKAIRHDDYPLSTCLGGFYTFPQISNNGDIFNLFATNSVLSEYFRQSVFIEPTFTDAN
jgi:hypothetical protein